METRLGLGSSRRAASVAGGAILLVAGLAACGAPSTAAAPGSAVGTGTSATSPASPMSSPTAGSSSGASTPGGAPTGTGSAPGVSPAPATTACPPAATAGSVVLGQADTGRLVCLRVGQRLEVVLRGEGGRPWRFAVSGDALVPASAAPAPPGGGVVAYRAQRPGVAQLSAAQQVCPSARPGQMACLALAQEWAVTVAVR